jgi:hypothetical protein
MPMRRYAPCATRAVLAVVLTVAGTLLGCHAAGKTGNANPPGQSAATTRPADVPHGWAATMGHAELWSQTCNRCHNAWSPDQLSPTEWEVVMHHMRLRANLTGDEQKAILEFLQSASR